MSDGTVTVILTRTVLPGMGRDFEDALAELLQKAEDAPGHLGVHVLRPKDGQNTWTFIFSFDSQANLDAWMQSDTRLDWQERVSTFSAEPPEIRTLTGLETWFNFKGLGPAAPPPRWKMMLVTWLALFPAISILAHFAGPTLGPLPPLVRTLVMTGILIPLMTYVLMPLLTRALRPWLFPTCPPVHRRPRAAATPAA